MQTVRRIPGLLATALLVLGCVGQTTSSPDPVTPAPSPSIEPTPRQPGTPRPVRTPKPTPLPDLRCGRIARALPPPRPDPTLPPDPNPSIENEDARAIAAIGRAVGQLAGLDSYRFTVDIFGVDLFQLERSNRAFGLQGTISRTDGFAMDTLLLAQMSEFGGEAAITSTIRLVMGQELLWATDNVSRVLEPSRASPIDRAFYLGLTPEGIPGRVVVPFAGGYRRVGKEMRGGVMTEHFRATPAGAAAYAAAFHFDGPITADAWIASEGGYLAAIRIAGKASVRDPSGALVDVAVLVQFDVTDPNDAANVVELPTPPVPDPVRPVQPPVDLRLEYEVMRSDVRDPTTKDVDAVGANLRGRLDVSRRPVKVTTGQPDKIVVTICGTTQPDNDRRLIVSNAQLTVVPLPAGEYGTITRPGPKALPAVGGPIDPELESVVPPARIGHGGTHVDPTTGRRGLAFRLGNNAAEVFYAYAKDHPGEYVALVLDGKVLATLPIDEQLERGAFIFTGDYTEAETEFLLDYLRSDPLQFELRLVEELEIPASR